MSIRDDEKIFEHESYGMVGFYRTTGGHQRLFGSVLPGHNETVCLRIKRGRRTHHLSRDWFSSTSGTPLIEIVLSPAQFAELLVGMNMGDGVPCTLHSVAGQKMAYPPDDHTTEAEEIQTGFAVSVEKIGRVLASLTEKVKILERAGPSKDDRAAIIALANRAAMEVTANLPFVLKSFQEAADKIKTAAKAEVDAWMTSVVQRAGFKAIAEGTAEIEPRQLGPK